jgi:hypothetical protein
MTIDVVQTPSEQYTPRTPTPEIIEAGPEPLPLEDNDTIAQSTDTQLTSNPLHPGYPWVRYNRQLHGAPIMLPDQNHGTMRAQFVAHEMESYYGEPSIYAMGEDDRVAHRYPLRAEASTLEEHPEDRDLMLLSEHNQLDLSVQRALTALGPSGLWCQCRCHPLSEHSPATPLPTTSLQQDKAARGSGPGRMAGVPRGI